MQRRNLIILLLVLALLISATVLGGLSVLNIVSAPWVNIASLILGALSVTTQTFAWLYPVSTNVSPPTPPARPNAVGASLIVLLILVLTLFTIGIGIQPVLTNFLTQYPSLEQVVKGTSKDYSLSNQDENGWSTTDNCAFIGGSYHVQVPKKENISLCFAEATPSLGNFAFQVQMTVVRGQGGGGGIIFRSQGHNSNSKMYRFRVGEDASYDLYAQDLDNHIQARLGPCPYPTDSNLSSPLLTSTNSDPSSSVINAGLNKTNTLTVIAKGGNIGLYVNSQLLLFVCNNISSSGFIGLYATSYMQPSDVSFENARLWTL